MDPARRPVFTPAMYLAMERASEVKHEYLAGEVWAMAGGSMRHNALAAECTMQLCAALKGSSCRTLNSDQRLHVPTTGSYCYPDVTVVCGEASFHTADADSITNPRLIVEVLSKSTQEHDRSTKFDEYRSISSFEEYVLVWQDRVKVEVRRREGPRRWVSDEYGPGDRVELRSVSATLDVDALYEGAFDLRGDGAPQRAP